MNDCGDVSLKEITRDKVGAVSWVTSRGRMFFGEVATPEGFFKFHTERRKVTEDARRYPFVGELLRFEPEVRDEEALAANWRFETNGLFPPGRGIYYGILREYQSARGFGFVPGGSGDVLVHAKTARVLAYQPQSRIPQFTKQELPSTCVSQGAIIAYSIDESFPRLRAKAWGIYDPSK